jgi:thymidylate synthase
MITGTYWGFSTLQDGYKAICEAVVNYGQESEPRGMLTKELICPTIRIEYPHQCLPEGIGRAVSLQVAAVEAVQLCGAFHDPELMVAASPHFEQFRERYTGTMHGAYGPRISTQGSAVVHKLEQDPDSRQAVVTLWRPELDNDPGKKDYPCTVSLQFLIRDDALVCVSTMRSNDVWLGLAYDLFQFGQLQWTIANMLGCDVGPLVHRPTSLHAYEHNWDQIEELHYPRYPPTELFGFSDILKAKRIGYDRLGDEESLTPTEAWFASRLDRLFKQKREARGWPAGG